MCSSKAGRCPGADHADFWTADVLRSQGTTAEPIPEATSLLAIRRGTHKDEASFGGALRGTGTRVAPSGKKRERGVSGRTSTRRRTAKSIIRSGGMGPAPSFLIFSTTRRERVDSSDVPRGEYTRSEPKVRLERKTLGQHVACRRKELEEFVFRAGGENPGAVAQHLPRPLQARVIDDGPHQEERAAEPKGFPALRERTARIRGFHDHRGVREESHCPIPPWKVRAEDRVVRRELRDDEVAFLHRPAEFLISPGKHDVDGVPEYANRVPLGSDGSPERDGVDSGGKAADDDGTAGGEKAGQFFGTLEAEVGGLPGSHY